LIATLVLWIVIMFVGASLLTLLGLGVLTLFLIVDLLSGLGGD